MSFSADGIETAERVLVAYAAGVWAYSLNHVLARAFFAQGDTTTPTRVAASMVLLNVGLNLALIWSLGAAGLAWSTAACAAIQALLLAMLLRRRVAAPWVARPDVMAVLRIAAASMAMFVAVLLVSRWLGTRESWTQQVVGLSVLVAVGGGVYLGAAVTLRCPEMTWLLPTRESEPT